MPSYRFRLLRYAPTISGEFYNVAVVLYDAAGGIIDARFANEFDRLRCNPAVEIPVLEALRNEFEEGRLLGEGFHGYFENLKKTSRSRYRLPSRNRSMEPTPQRNSIDSLQPISPRRAV